jgi:hypothetical protein
MCIFLLFCSMVLHSNDYVSGYPGIVTQIEAPAIVLLAHNFSDGKYFSEIPEGTEITYGDEWEKYIVTDVIEVEGMTYIPPQINDTNTLILATCIKKGDNWTWGRLWIIAEKQ